MTQLTEDQIFEAAALVSQAIGYVDSIRSRKEMDVTYETMQRAGFNRKTNWRRPYRLTDARIDANSAAIALRQAWEILDPIDPAISAALGPCGK